MPTETGPSLGSALKASLSKPLGDGGDLRLTAALTGEHPAQMVQAIDELTKPEALAAFNSLHNERAAEVLDELDPETVRFLTDNAPPGRIAILLDHLPMDDAAEVVSEADPRHTETFLAALSDRAPDDAEEVRRLLAYPEDSAGSLMTDKFAVIDH